MAADPSVSLADTIRRALERAKSLAVTGTPTYAAYREATDALAELLAAGERDRRQIARLTDFVRAYDNLDDALDNLLDYLKLIGWSEQEDRNVKAALKWAERVSGYYGRCNAARAVLADEEDVPPHFFGEQGIRPEPNHTWPLAGEEDAGDE